MTRFTYQAIDPEGNEVRGVKKAGTTGDVRYQLSQQNMTVLDIRQKRSWYQVDVSEPKIKPKELMHISRQLAAFIRAGIPILDAIAELGDSSDSRAVRHVLSEVGSDLRSGTPLSEAFERHPKDFPPFYLGILKSSELTGELDTVLDQLAGYLERDLDARGKIKAALMYPAVVSVMAIGTIAILTIYVLPKFQDFFSSLDAPLPAATQALLNITGWLGKWWWAILIVSVVIAITYMITIRTVKGRAWRDRRLLHFPVVGEAVRCGLIERFTRLLGAMVAAGVPLPDAMQTAADSLNNLAFTQPLEIAREQMLAGAGLAGPISETRMFPGVAAQMIRVGESTGTLDHQLQVAADYYAGELDQRVKRLSTLVEPVVVVVVGVIVGFVAIALVSAMYGIFRATTISS